MQEGIVKLWIIVTPRKLKKKHLKKIVVERALEDWIDTIYIGGDSEIALAYL